MGVACTWTLNGVWQVGQENATSWKLADGHSLAMLNHTHYDNFTKLDVSEVEAQRCKEQRNHSNRAWASG